MTFAHFILTFGRILLIFDTFWLLTHILKNIVNYYPLLTHPSAASDPQIYFYFWVLCIKPRSSAALWALHRAVCLSQGMAPPAGTGQTSMHRHCTTTHALYSSTSFPFCTFFYEWVKVLFWNPTLHRLFGWILPFFIWIHIKLDILNVKESIIFTINLPNDGKIVKTQMLIVLSLAEWLRATDRSETGDGL